MLDQKIEANDVVTLDSFGQPVDRGPSVLEAKKLMRSWQYQVSGKLSVAAALSELDVEHIKHGEARDVLIVLRAFTPIPPY